MSFFKSFTLSDHAAIACDVGACCLAVAALTFGVMYVAIAVLLEDTNPDAIPEVKDRNEHRGHRAHPISV